MSVTVPTLDRELLVVSPTDKILRKPWWFFSLRMELTLLKSFQLCQAFAMIGSITKSKLIPLGAFEPKMHVMLPGEADAAMHLHGAIGRPCIHIRQTSFGK